MARYVAFKSKIYRIFKKHSNSLIHFSQKSMLWTNKEFRHRVLKSNFGLCVLFGKYWSLIQNCWVEYGSLHNPNKWSLEPDLNILCLMRHETFLVIKYPLWIPFSFRPSQLPGRDRHLQRPSISRKWSLSLDARECSA